MLKTARGTNALLALEDDGPAVLFERLSGATTPFWPTVRTEFMVALQQHDFGSVAIPRAAPSRWRPMGRLARSVLPFASGDARGFRARRSALFLVSGVTTYASEGRLRNWLVGDFAERFAPSSVILQWSELGAPGPAFTPTLSLDPLMARSAVDARLSRANVDATAIRGMVQELANRLDDRITAEQVDRIVASATYAVSMAPSLEKQFSALLDAIRPRVVIMEDASYGSRAPLISLMKQRGIAVVEPQHGWIGPTHAAYNFGAAMRAPELLQTLPDELLTFGSLWSEGIRHPAEVSAIGKPYLELRAAAAPAWGERPKEVLIVSSVTDPEETTEFALALHAAIPSDWVVRFRPHPSERAAVVTMYGPMLEVEGIVLDEESDLYDSLARARGVVGVASTVLFEALAMGCRVFALDSVFAEYYVGERFGPTISGARDAEILVGALVDGQSTEFESLRDELWRPNAISNFIRWADGRLS